MAKSNLMDMDQRQVHVRLNQWNLVMIIAASINELPGYIWNDYFKAVTLHSYCWLRFTECINYISPPFKTVEIAYSHTHEGSYCD